MTSCLLRRRTSGARRTLSRSRVAVLCLHRGPGWSPDGPVPSEWAERAVVQLPGGAAGVPWALRPRGHRPVADDGDPDVRLVSGPAPRAGVHPVPAVRTGPPRQLAAAPVRPGRLRGPALTVRRARRGSANASEK